MAGHFVVIAEFATTPATHAGFLEVCAYDSERSVADEPGCHGFVALTPENDGQAAAGTVVLVETYADRQSFDAHLETPHYRKFAETVKSLGIERRHVRFLTQQAP